MTTTTSSERSVCARIIDRLANAVGERRYNMWFNRTARFLYDDADARLEVAVPNQFVAKWIGRNFEGHLREAARHETGVNVNLDVQVNPELFTDEHGKPLPGMPVGHRAATAANPNADPAPSPKPAAKPPRPRLRHRLDTFIIGSSNELAYSAACRLADEPDTSAINPLFIHGGCGLGKTHLLQGICARLLDQQPNARVLYTTGEQFTNDFLTAMRANRIDDFRRRIRQLDLLAVDDIHFIANKQATQQEFLHSFDAIDLGGARVVLASDSHPKLINAFSEALVSRCVRGMVVEVRQPNEEMRRRLVAALAKRRHLVLRDSAVNALAERCAGSVRDIEGLLTKLMAYARLVNPASNSDPNEPIGHAVLNQLFEQDGQSRPRKAVRFTDILDAVAEQLGVDRADILDSTRRKPSVIARSLAAHLARQLTSMSYPEIAAAMGRPNHSTIITAVQRMEKQLQDGSTFTLPATLETVALRDLHQRIQHVVGKA